MRLCDGKKNVKYIVKELLGEGNQKRRLLELGFTPNTEVEITAIAPLKGTLLVGLYGYLLGLRREAAEVIIVERKQTRSGE